MAALGIGAAPDAGCFRPPSETVGFAQGLDHENERRTAGWPVQASYAGPRGRAEDSGQIARSCGLRSVPGAYPVQWVC
jgi:hypothetical protein